MLYLYLFVAVYRQLNLLFRRRRHDLPHRPGYGIVKPRMLLADMDDPCFQTRHLDHALQQEIKLLCLPFQTAKEFPASF